MTTSLLGASPKRPYVRRGVSVSITRMVVAGLVVLGVVGAGLAFYSVGVALAVGPPFLGLAPGPAENITTTTVTLTGSVTPLEVAKATSIEFEYGSADVSENTVLATPSTVEGSEPTTVAASLSGLEPGTLYHYRVKGTPEGQPVEHGEGEAEFVTLPRASVIAFEASEVGAKAAQLNGSIVLNVAGPAKYHFEYTPEGGAPANTPTEEVSGEGEHAISLPVTGLEPETFYHVKLIAEVEGQIFESETAFFTLVRAFSTAAFSEVTTGSAKLEGNITLNVAGPANYHFEYTPAEGAPENTPIEEVSGTGEHAVSGTVSALEPSKRYAVRLIVEVEGHEYISETAFPTLGLTPVVTSNPAEHITRTTAGLSGEVNPRNDETAWFIEYGETTAYGHSTSSNMILLPSGNAPRPIGPEVIEELKGSTTYHYRFVAVDSSGTEVSTDRMFTTAAAQPPTIESEAGVATSQTTATISAQINANGLPTSYTLEVGPDMSYGTQLSGHLPESGRLELTLTGLLPGSAYHFRVLATNPDGTATASDATFTTPGFPQTLQPPAPVTLIAFTAPVNPPAGGSTHPKTLTRAQHLAKALKACKKQPKRKHAACVRQAHKHYGPLKGRK